MQTNYGSSGNSSYANYANQQRPKPVPGLKVAYGSQAQAQSQTYSPVNIPLPTARNTMGQTQPTTEPMGLFAKVKQKLFHMVTEEAPNDYPIGISQLSRKTFLASEDTAALFRSGQAIQDYRFTQLIEPRRR